MLKMNDEEKEKMELEESSPMLKSKGPVSSDDLIEEFARKRSWKYTALIMSLMFVWLAGPSCVYLTSFAGLSCHLLIRMKIKHSVLSVCLTCDY